MPPSARQTPPGRGRWRVAPEGERWREAPEGENPATDADFALAGEHSHKNAQYHSKTGPPNSIAITMPAHRNGPKAKWSFFPAFLAASR